MGRDRNVKTEWGDWKNKRFQEYGFCDHGFRFQCIEEAEVYQELKTQGYTVHKHGWPDFMATKGTEVRLIEVKSQHDVTKESQKAVHRGLKRLGVSIETITKFNPNRVRIRNRGR